MLYWCVHYPGYFNKFLNNLKLMCTIWDKIKKLTWLQAYDLGDVGVIWCNFFGDSLFQIYVMNFVDFVIICYSHITSHVSQVFASCTHYTSNSLLNIVHVIMCVFGLTNQVCKYFEFLCKTDLMLENLWRMFANLNFGKTGFKTIVFEKYFITYSCILFINFNALRCF